MSAGSDACIEGTAARQPGDPTSPPARVDGPHAFAWLWIVSLGVFGLVALSGRLTPFPSVLSDEATYLLSALHGYRDENFDRWEIVARIPNHLFYAIYSTLAGPDLYARAKLLNAAFIALSVYPIYAVARSCLPVRESAWLAAVCVSTPVTSFARYFMPESLYHLGFWCAVWVTITMVGMSVWRMAMAAGVVLALLSFVKPHAVALAAGIGSFLLLREGPWTHRLGPLALLVVVFCVSRAMASYGLAGTIELWPAGPTYSNVLGSPLVADAALVNGLGHLAALLALAGVPLLVIVRALFRHSAHEGAARDLALLAICLLLPLLAMTIYFSAAVYAIAPEVETITRLHGRYYAFALSLVMIAYLAVVRRAAESQIPARKTAWWLFATFASLLVVAGWYETGFVDFPELSVLTRWPTGVLVAAIAAAVSLASVARTRNGSGVRWLAVPVLWWATIGVTTSLALWFAPLAGMAFKPNAVDQVMSTNPVLLALRGRDDVMVVGTSANAPDTFRVLFYLASLARARIVAPGSVLGSPAIPHDIRSLILLPGVSFDGPGEAIRVGPLTQWTLR